MSDSPVIIVTGASRGLGASVALWLGKAGCKVSLMARSKAELKRVAEHVERMGGNSMPFSADVADPAACRRVVEETFKSFGRLDGLVNNAAVLQPLAPVALADSESWRYNIEVNLLGPFYMSRVAIPHLRKQKGRIVNVSSGAANSPIESASAYCITKSGLNYFTRLLAAEEPDLTCVAVRPGVVDTQMQELIRKEGPNTMPPERVSYFLNLKAEGQLESPYVPARSIAWLALHAPKEFSGSFMSYDDPMISGPSRLVFGDKIDISGKI
jgi:NAD(P)-dependent dehydrogenase (short-subunit alcohol dehydrogenase family)